MDERFYRRVGAIPKTTMIMSAPRVRKMIEMDRSRQRLALDAFRARVLAGQAKMELEFAKQYGRPEMLAKARKNQADALSILKRIEENRALRELRKTEEMGEKLRILEEASKKMKVAFDKGRPTRKLDRALTEFTSALEEFEGAAKK
ncbi:hypothetical protein HY546_03385 [archaeon]|nr:hypothetical protein [archaeon]